MNAGYWRLLLALGLSVQAFGLDPGKALTQVAHRIWSQEEGLFQPTVYSIAQTRNGFLWLGTQDSLIRFDGLHFREYDHAAEAGIQRSLIRNLLEDKQGNLWVGTLGSGLVRIAPDGGFKSFTSQDGLDSRTAFCLYSGRDGAIFVCTDKGLLQFDRERFKHVDTSGGLQSAAIRDVCQTADGTMWVAGLVGGVALGRNGKFESFAMPDQATRGAANGLVCPAGGAVWIASSNGLTRVEHGAAKTFTVIDGLPDNEVSSLYESPDGSLWIGTNDGVTRYRNGQFTIYRVRDGLSHSLVLSLYTDREGTLWVGTKNGLDQFNDSKVTPYTTNEGMASNNSSAVVEDSSGRLWAGTLGQGLNSFDGAKFDTVTTKDGLLDNNVVSLLPESDGDLWVGTRRGISRLHNGRVAESFTQAQGLPGATVSALFRDPAGTLWAGTDRGLATLQGGRFKASQSGLLADKRIVYALSAIPSVRLFASAEGPSLSYLEGDRARSQELETSQPVSCFYFDPLHRAAWLGTSGSGLLYWKDGKVTHVRIKDGLYDNRIYAILRDDHQNLWFASSKGIFRVSEAELLAFAEGRTRYVASLPFSTSQLRFECRAGVQPAAYRTHDGRLWFSTTNGLVVVDPNRLNNNPVPPPVEITSVVINGRRGEARQDFQLSPAERNLEIRYAGLSFIAPEKMTFRYLLDGYDKAWVEAGTRREAFYDNLPPGQFQFQVMARNADGVWSKGPATLAFRVLPRFYQHVWFFPVLILLMAAGVFGWYRLRIRRLQQRFDLVLAERSRIARELHDTLLQGLSGVTMQLQALWTRLAPSKEKQSLQEIIQDAARCSTEARQSLWGLRASTSGATDFTERLALACREANTGGALEMDLKLDAVSLAAMPDAEFQLLRIAREAVTNAVRHSQGSRLEVQLKAGKAALQLSFEDDGRGFNAQTASAGHFGLIGMRERAEELGAQLNISSEPGQGVKIVVQVPLASARGIRNNQKEHQLQ